jgi:hypothetical protein
MAGKGLEKFYSKYGFKQRPDGYIGCDMTQLWGRDDEVLES